MFRTINVAVSVIYAVVLLWFGWEWMVGHDPVRQRWSRVAFLVISVVFVAMAFHADVHHE